MRLGGIQSLFIVSTRLLLPAVCNLQMQTTDSIPDDRGIHIPFLLGTDSRFSFWMSQMIRIPLPESSPSSLGILFQEWDLKSSGLTLEASLLGAAHLVFAPWLH
jgi:hypothetical protein